MITKTSLKNYSKKINNYLYIFNKMNKNIKNHKNNMMNKQISYKMSLKMQSKNYPKSLN